MSVLSHQAPTPDPGKGPCTAEIPVALAEVRSALAARGSPARFLLVDVRDRGVISAGHVRGALCVPLGEIRRFAAGLPRDRCLVPYGDDAKDPRPAEAAALLRSRGLHASPFAEGFSEWVEAGLPVHAAAVDPGRSRCSCSLVAVRPPRALRVG